MFRRLSPLFAIAFVLLPLGLRADGFIYIPGGAGDVIGSRPRILHPPRPRPPVRPHFPLSITRHRVLAGINDGLVKTRVEETFHNSSGRQLEGFYMFPLPDGASASGFTMKLQDRAGVGREALTAARDQMLGMAIQSSLLADLRPEDQPPAPQLHVEVDRVQARAMGLSMTDVNNALSINFGSAYANDFNRDGRVLQVLVQADAEHRMTPEDVLSLRIPNAQGELVPFSSFAMAEWTAGPPSLARYNGYPAMTISGTAAPGESSGAALAEMEQLASQLPEGIGFEWTGISYEEKQAGGQIGLLLGLSVIIVFLVLAALYESWAVPFAVLLIVPMGVLGAVLFTMLRGLSADIYFNVGLITIIGLAAKNAILIVEFAIEEEAEGKSPMEAVKAAARLRLRPIIMTSLAFILGMVPLVISTGAGAASRIAVGTGVMGGMIAATAIGIFVIPLLYMLIRTRIGGRQPKPAGTLEGDGA